MHTFYEEELAELKAAGRAAGRESKKDSRYEVARGDLPTQSLVYEYVWGIRVGGRALLGQGVRACGRGPSGRGRRPSARARRATA